jgi:hypothetical protein
MRIVNARIGNKGAIVHPRVWIKPEGAEFGQWVIITRCGDPLPGESWESAELERIQLAEGRARGLKGSTLTATLTREKSWLSASHWELAQQVVLSFSKAEVDALWCLDGQTDPVDPEGV